MRFASVREMKTAKLRKLLAEDNFALELELHRLDCISCHGKMEGFVYLVDQLRNRGDERLPESLLRGRDLVAAGFAPSARFGKVLHDIYELQLAGEITETSQALDLASKMLSE